MVAIAAIENTIIYLIGFAGCGKLTIAQEIQKLIPAILVDNHLINNVVFSLIDPDGVTPLPKSVWENTRRVREIVLDTIRELSPPQRNFIFTNELIEGKATNQEVFNKISSLAADRGALFFPVRLLISPEELCRRIVSPERKAKFKTISPALVHQKMLQQEILYPSHPYFELEVSDLSASRSAQVIVEELKRSYRSRLRNVDQQSL